MSVDQQTQIEVGYEAGLGLIDTTNTKSIGSEPFLNMTPSSPANQFGQALPDALPALNFGETDESGLIKRVRMPLTMDRSVTGGKVWVARSIWASTWSGSDYKNEKHLIMARFLSEKDKPFFGHSAYGGNNGADQIAPLDASAPVWYPRVGVLVFKNGRPETGDTEAESIWIESNYYEGLMLDEVINSVSETEYSFDPLAAYTAKRNEGGEG